MGKEKNSADEQTRPRPKPYEEYLATCWDYDPFGWDGRISEKNADKPGFGFGTG